MSGVELFEDDGVSIVSSPTNFSTQATSAPANRVARELFREERLWQSANRKGNKIFLTTEEF